MRRAPGTGCSGRRGRAGFSEEELLAAGLAQRSHVNPDQVYDRFRERIMFPSADARGRVLGFGARAMRENQPPKYLNTSEGELYHKRSQLFGIDLARRGRRSRRPDDPRRGLHRRARAPPGGAAQRGRDHGDVVDRGAGRRARADRPRAGAVPRRRPRRAGGDAPRRRRLAERASHRSSCASCRCRPGPIPPSWSSARGARQLRDARRALGAVRRLPRRPDPRARRHCAAPRGATGRVDRARTGARRAARRAACARI